MLVISAAMKKGGSGWFFNVTHDLVLAATGVDTRKLRRSSPIAAEIIHPPNCVVKPLNHANLEHLDHLRQGGRTLVVKTHASPGQELRRRLESRRTRAAYLYRDPRAVALSAWDHAKSIHANPDSFINKGPYEFLESLEDAIVFASKQLRIWRAWTQLEDVLVVRYEDFVTDDQEVARQLCKSLDLDLGPRRIERIVRRYRPSRLNQLRSRRVHFNVGAPRRFEHVMNRRQLDLCDELFGDHLRAMGYQPL